MSLSDTRGIKVELTQAPPELMLSFSSEAQRKGVGVENLHYQGKGEYRLELICLDRIHPRFRHSLECLQQWADTHRIGFQVLTDYSN